MKLTINTISPTNIATSALILCGKLGRRLLLHRKTTGSGLPVHSALPGTAFASDVKHLIRLTAHEPMMRGRLPRFSALVGSNAASLMPWPGDL
jgi:hypothetical protein